MRTNWIVECLSRAIAPLIFALLLTDSVHAQRLNWSFADYPQPETAELSKEEIASIKIVEAENTQSEPSKYCSEVPRAYFQIYNDRYPAFAKIDTESARYLAWKAHIITRGTASPASCIVGDLSIRLMRSISWPAKISLAYCGVYSRAPRNAQEKDFHDYLNELVGYAELGSLDAISDLLVANSGSRPIMLNPDVEYYLRKTLKQSGDYEWNWGTNHLGPLLAEKRIEFLNKAVENNDLNAVLQTTPPCVL